MKLAAAEWCFENNLLHFPHGLTADASSEEWKASCAEERVINAERYKFNDMMQVHFDDNEPHSSILQPDALCTELIYELQFFRFGTCVSVERKCRKRWC